MLVRLVDFVKEWKNYCVEKESNNNNNDYDDVDWTFEYLKTIAQSSINKFSKFKDSIICNQDLECGYDDTGNLTWSVV